MKETLYQSHRNPIDLRGENITGNTRKIKIGISYNLKDSVEIPANAPDDFVEELDCDETISSIENILIEAGYDVVRLGADKNFVQLIQIEKPDLVFNIAEGLGSRSREAHIPAILEFYNIPFTGSDPLVLSLTLDKSLTKSLVKSIGVRTADFVVLKSKNDRIDNFKFPAILKPVYEGSSIGIRQKSRVNSLDELHALAYELIDIYKQPVLVEEFLLGKEITVGLLGNGYNRKILAMMEIVPKKTDTKDFIYSLEVKRNWREEVEYRVNPDFLNDGMGDEIRDYAFKIADLLDLKDFARIDFRLDSENRPNFLEINPLPGLNPDYSDLPIMARGVGFPYKNIILEIVNSARERYKNENCYRL